VSEVILIGFGLVAMLAVGRFAAEDERVSIRLTFPRSTSAEQGIAALRSLGGLLPPWWRRPLGVPAVTLELRATAAGIEHVLTVPRGRVEYVTGALRAAIPGLRLNEQDTPLVSVDLVRELRPSGGGRLRADQSEATNAAILAALQPLDADEQVVVQYVLIPTSRRVRSILDTALDFASPDRPAPESLEPDFTVALRVGVAARTNARRKQLMARLLAPFHGLNGDNARLRRRLLPSEFTASSMQREARPAGGSSADAEELAAFTGLPLDAPDLPGLSLATSRELAPTAAVPRRGLVLGDATVTSGKRPIAVTLAEARRGLHVCAPTGAGKSTLLTGLAVQLMKVRSRPALVLIDSKGDLIADLADRIPPARRGDVVVFDPADRERPVGFNLIGGSGEADLVVDHVVSELRARYGAAGLGPRSEDILRAALTTLTSGREEYTLCEVEPLLGNRAFRQKILGGLDEPVLESFWSWYGSLSEAARAEAIAPLSNKLRTYTLRRRVRAVIGQTGGLDLAKALEGGQIVLISLAKGLIGADAAALIGAAMTSRLWTAIQARAGLPQRQRRPAMVVCDEFQDFASLPLAFGEAVAQSRGYGVGWILAHQHLAQLDTATRQAVLANCRSRLVMQTTAADASAFAREFRPHVSADDLQGLDAFTAYAAVSTGAAVAPPASLRTRKAPAPLGCAGEVRAASRERYGIPAADVDAAIRARIAGTTAAPVGGTRRGA
jgi:TraM recognition site of TraD and TraG